MFAAEMFYTSASDILAFVYKNLSIQKKIDSRWGRGARWEGLGVGWPSARLWFGGFLFLFLVGAVLTLLRYVCYLRMIFKAVLFLSELVLNDSCPISVFCLSY